MLDMLAKVGINAGEKVSMNKVLFNCDDAHRAAHHATRWPR